MKRISILLGIILIGIIIGIFWWQNGLLALDSTNKNTKIFVVHTGEGVRAIANNLKDQGLIRDPIVFFLLIRQKGFDKQIQAGDFRLSPSMNANEVAANLTHGILDIWVTFPEGVRADEIADILQAKIPSYNQSWRAQLIANEGYLFPDTYLIPKEADIKLILSLFKNNFDKKYQTVIKDASTNLTQNQVIIVASMVEREAKTESERPLVASVILNRLSLGMKLDIDATIQYALGYSTSEKSWWKKNLTIDDLSFDSPYNTRLVAGLPPTPISNPGLSAIKAVLSPAKSDYLYYMTDGKGITHFAKTVEEHNANIKTYGL
jgi:UPF0755 protein